MLLTKDLELTERSNISRSVTLDSTIESVETIEDLALDFAVAAGFDQDTASHIAMVTRAAAVNAVKHGNGFSPDKRVRAGFALNDRELTISISDEGTGLELETVKDPLAEENLLRTSGRGIFLMRAIMDEVHFRKMPVGTEITMVKTRTKKETEA